MKLMKTCIQKVIWKAIKIQEIKKDILVKNLKNQTMKTQA